jgi:hypothetical protein
MEVFWDVTLRRWVSLGTLDPEDEGSRILRNIWAVQSQQHSMTSRKNFKYSTEIVPEKSAEGRLSRYRPEQAHGRSGRLRPRIFLTFGTRRW